jgi:hypothetical protein
VEYWANCKILYRERYYLCKKERDNGRKKEIKKKEKEQKHVEMKKARLEVCCLVNAEFSCLYNFYIG